MRFAQILGCGLAVWWRFTRLAVLTLILQLIVTTAPWLPFLADVRERFLLPLLIFGSVLTVLGTTMVWLATLRGMWLLGEPGRRSAMAAWVRGLWAVLRQPLRSFLPFLVWALPGLVLLVLPLIYDGPAPGVFLLIAWLVVRAIRHHQANGYRAAALRELEAVATAAGDPSTRAQSLAAIAPLLKRTALCVFPRPEVASLTGEAWLQFLADSGGEAFANGAGRLLQEATYGETALNDEQTAELLDASRHWIRYHKRAVVHG